jgi:hypothetical protein
VLRSSNKLTAYIAKNLFDEIVEQIFKFGKKIKPRIESVDEKQFQRLLEGYLNAMFPEEIIIPEYAFEGYKENSRIDFIIGKEQIPIEVKLCGNNPIGDYIRDGSGQLKECLRYNNIEKGILVIGVKKRKQDSKKFNGLHDGIYTIVI